MGTSLTVGLTGTIGSGKSTVAANLKRVGIPVIAADEIGHAILGNRTVKRRLVAAFGPDILGPSGMISRGSLGKLAFASSVKMKMLNAITHPPLLQAVKRAIRRLKGKEIVVIDAALIVEWGSRLPVDVVVVVEAAEAARLTRIRGRYDISSYKSRKKYQLSAAAKRKAADIVIINDGSLRLLRTKTEALLNILRTRGRLKTAYRRRVVI